MKFKKLDYKFKPAPNVPYIDEVRMGKDYDLTFNLSVPGKGRLTFRNCIAHTFGEPNDQAFANLHPYAESELINYKKLGFALDELYEVEGLANIFHRKVTSSEELTDPPAEKCKHYIFFTKEGTFQCFATSYDFEKLN
jgi:hypothetical protein